jgi:predicted Zn-dependent protease
VQVGGFLFSLKDVRNAEREADLLGMEYQYAAGYDPQTFIEFFEKLRARGKESHTLIARAFATHPMTKERIQRAEREISTLLPAKDQYVVDTSDFEETKARLGRLTAGPAESKDPQPVLRRIAPRDGRSVDFQEHR